MKTIKFIGYLFYRYYSKTPALTIPYFATLCSLSMIGFMHFFLLLILVNKTDLIPGSDNKPAEMLAMLLVFVPLFLLMAQVFRKSDIPLLAEQFKSRPKAIQKGYLWLIGYIIVLFSAIMLLALVDKNKI